MTELEQKLLDALKACVLVMDRDLKGLAVIQPELLQAKRAIADAEAHQAGFEKRFAVVPKRLTREMNRVIEEEGWEWADLLAAAEAITEEEYAALADDEAQQAEPVRLTDEQLESLVRWYGAEPNIYLDRAEYARSVQTAVLRANGLKVEG